jgi:hypothetical protein
MKKPYGAFVRGVLSRLPPAAARAARWRGGASSAAVGALPLPLLVYPLDRDHCAPCAHGRY